MPILKHFGLLLLPVTFAGAGAVWYLERAMAPLAQPELDTPAAVPTLFESLSYPAVAELSPLERHFPVAKLVRGAEEGSSRKQTVVARKESEKAREKTAQASASPTPKSDDDFQLSLNDIDLSDLSPELVLRVENAFAYDNHPTSETPALKQARQSRANRAPSENEQDIDAQQELEDLALAKVLARKIQQDEQEAAIARKLARTAQPEIKEDAIGKESIRNPAKNAQHGSLSEVSVRDALKKTQDEALAKVFNQNIEQNAQKGEGAKQTARNTQQTAKPKSSVDNIKDTAAKWKNRLPALNFQTHMHSTDTNNSWIEINNTTYRQGDFIHGVVLLKEIQPQAVIVEFQGEQIRIPALYEWKG